MPRSFLPATPGKVTPKKLAEMRRSLILTMYQDLLLLGYRTEAVTHLQQRIVRAKLKANRDYEQETA